MNFIAAILIFVFGIGSGVWVQTRWHEIKEKKHAEQHLADETNRARVAIRQAEKAIQAQVTAAHRVDMLRRDAAGSRRALVSLSSTADQAVRDATASHDACVERAGTLSELLKTVADAGGELAAKADQTNSDKQTLIDSWPK